jgi:hypothetical protein
MIANYSTVMSAAGFSGGDFDISAGYGLSFTPASADAAFNVAGTITLTAGVWPTWLREVGKVFKITGTTLNNSTFTVVSVDGTFKIMTVKEVVATEAAQTPVCDGSADTAIIDVLLKAGNGVLTCDAPFVLTSTGALTSSRTLSIAGLEVESAQQGSEKMPGRFFYLSVQNSDISPSVKITVSASASINGAGTFEIAHAGDYMFYHVSEGVWRCNIMPRPGESHATIARVPFTSAMWSAGTVNQIVIIPTGVLAAGQAGPHALKVYGSYVVTVINTDLTPDEVVDVETQFDGVGNITLVKAQKAKPFNGVAVIIGSLE